MVCRRIGGRRVWRAQRRLEPWRARSQRIVQHERRSLACGRRARSGRSVDGPPTRPVRSFHGAEARQRSRRHSGRAPLREGGQSEIPVAVVSCGLCARVLIVRAWLGAPHRARSQAQGRPTRSARYGAGTPGKAASGSCLVGKISPLGSPRSRPEERRREDGELQEPTRSRPQAATEALSASELLSRAPTRRLKTLPDRLRGRPDRRGRAENGQRRPGGGEKMYHPRTAIQAAEGEAEPRSRGARNGNRAGGRSGAARAPKTRRSRPRRASCHGVQGPAKERIRNERRERPDAEAAGHECGTCCDGAHRNRVNAGNRGEE